MYKETYKALAVSKLHSSGLAQLILGSRGKKDIEIEAKKFLGPLNDHRHRNANPARIFNKDNPNYFEFIKDYIRVVNSAAYENNRTPEGRLNLTKKGIKMDNQAIESFCIGWETSEIKHYYGNVSVK